ncbi:MAG: PAS domain S-box protein [Rhizobiaceae bacterium]
MGDNAHTQMLEALLEAAVDAIITIDNCGIMQSVNQSAEILFGYERTLLVGKNINMLMPEPWASMHDGILRNYQATKQKKIIGTGREVQGLKRDGSVFPMHLSVSEFEVSSELFFTGIIHDLTNRKRAEDALVRSQKLEAIGKLTGGIAHDFNNLLTIIIGNIELIEMRLEDERLKELLVEAQEAAEYGADLTERLLTVARRRILTPEVLELNQLVKNMKKMLARTLGNNIGVETSLDEGLWNTMADPGQIESVLLNLTLNARDAMPSGGRLMIETKNIEFDSHYVEQEIGLAPGSYVCISVSDTGEGMNEKVLKSAFEPFFTTKPTGKGTGLGLSMVYGFAKQSDGHVTIYSELGLGSTINLYLPKHEGQPESNSRNPVVAGDLRRGNGELVLIVEDDVRVQKITVERIKSLGYKVLTADNGDDAIDLLSKSREIDLVFTDLVMPGATSGYDLVKHITAQYSGISVLMTSGYAEDLIGESDLKSMKISLLRKPYRQADLAIKLNETLKNENS